MIDPVSIGIAFAGAQAAVKGIKEVLALGKDVSEISDKVLDFFTHQTVVEHAARKAQFVERQAKTNTGKKQKKSLNELTAEAFDIVYKERQLQRAQYELYELFIWSGNADVWHAMIKQRNILRKAQEDAEGEELRLQFLREKALIEKKQFLMDMGMCAIAIAVVGLIFWGCVEYMLYLKLVLPAGAKIK